MFNESVGNPPLPEEDPDVTDPNVVLTWPIPGREMASPAQLVHAIASDASGSVARVEF